MSVIVGDDIVPRLSLHSVHNLKAEILREIYKSKLPKFKIIWKYSLSFVKEKNGENDEDQYLPAGSSSDNESDLDLGRSSIISINESPPLLQEIMVTQATPQDTHHLNNKDSEIIEEMNEMNETNDKANLFQTKTYLSTHDKIKEETTKLEITAKNMFSNFSNLFEINDFKNEGIDYSNEEIDSQAVAIDLIKKMKKHVKETYPKLVIPGNILYIYQINNKRKQSCCHSMCSTIFCCFDSCQVKNLVDYDSRWAYRDEFKKIVITKRLLLDHFPNQVDDALNYFNSTNRYV